MPPVALFRQCDITGKPRGTHICVPYKPAGNLHFSQLYLTFRLFVGRGLDPSLLFCDCCKFPRRGGVTPPYGATKNTRLRRRAFTSYQVIFSARCTRYTRYRNSPAIRLHSTHR